MTKRFIYLVFNESEEVKEIETDEKLEAKEEEKTEETKEQKEEQKEEIKETKVSKKKDTKKSNNITITEEEYRQFNELKRSNMSTEELIEEYKTEIEGYKTKNTILEETVSELTNIIEDMKNQELVKSKLSKIKEDKPYLAEVLEKRELEGFKNITEIDKFINIVDSEILKNAYEINKKIGIATKVTGTTTVNVNKGEEKSVKQTKVDISKYIQKM